MKNWRKIGAAALAAAVMATTAVSAGALDVTADSVVVDEEYDSTYYYWDCLKFYIDSNGFGAYLNYELTSFDDITEVVIPETINGEKVTILQNFEGYRNANNLKSITIPVSIERIHVVAGYNGDYMSLPFFSNLTDIYYEGTREQWEEIECYITPFYNSGTFGKGKWGMPFDSDGNAEFIEEIVEDYGNITPSEFIFGDATIHFSDGTTAKPSEIGDTPKVYETEEFTSNGVTATADEGVIPEGAEFSATLKSVTDENFTYNLKFTKDGEEIQPEGTVTIKLPIPETFLGITPLYVYRVEADGTRTALKSKIEDGYIIFETDHFSEYLITAEELDEDDNYDNSNSSDSEDSESSDNESNDSESSNSGNESNSADSSNSENSGSEVPDTGFGGIAMTLGVIALAGAAIVVSKKRN